MKTQKILLTLLLGLLFFNLVAQNELSLSDAIKIGLKNNYDLQITRKTEEVAGINNNWGNTGIMPSVSFSLSGRENYNLNDDENYRTQTISPDLGLNWLFFNGFYSKISKQKFDELEAQSHGNTVILIESSIQDIILAYNNCVLQKEMVDVYKELADLSKDRYDRNINAEALGASTTYELLQAKNSWLEDQANYLQQQVTYENAVRSLNYILAVDDNNTWVFTTKLETDTPDYNINDLSTKLTADNSTLKNQFLYQSILAKETAIAKSDYYPSLSLNTGISNTDLGNFYAGSTENYTNNHTDAYIGVTLSYSIFNGGVRKRSVQIAKIDEEIGQVQTDQMEHGLSNQLLQMYSNYGLQKELLELADEKMAAAKLNLDLSTAKFENGSINSFNYRDVQQIYSNAAITKFTAIYNLIKSNTDLLRITGGIISEYE